MMRGACSQRLAIVMLCGLLAAVRCSGNSFPAGTASTLLVVGLVTEEEARVLVDIPGSALAAPEPPKNHVAFVSRSQSEYKFDVAHDGAERGGSLREPSVAVSSSRGDVAEAAAARARRNEPPADDVAPPANHRPAADASRSDTLEMRAVALTDALAGRMASEWLCERAARGPALASCAPLAPRSRAFGAPMPPSALWRGGDSGGPLVAHFYGLEKNTTYCAEVLRNGVPVAAAVFHTAPPKHVAVMSCNRYYEDHDPTLLQMIAPKKTPDTVSVMLGDQVYADWVFASSEYERASPREKLDMMRHVYRVTFGADVSQRHMRIGMHLAVPDDHDVVNNLDSWTIEKHPEKVFAGILAILEFQFNLFIDTDRDIVADFVANRLNLSELSPWIRLYNAIPPLVSTRDQGVILVDTRIRPSLWRFIHGQESAEVNRIARVSCSGVEWAGETMDSAQFCAFSAALSRPWNTDHHRFIGFSVPLFYPPPPLAFVPEVVEKDVYLTHKKRIGGMMAIADILADAAKREEIVVVGGDIHMQQNVDLCIENDVCIPQVVSSGMTRASSMVNCMKCSLFHLLSLGVPSSWSTVSSASNRTWTVSVSNIAVDRHIVIVPVEQGVTGQDIIESDHVSSLRQDLIRVAFRYPSIAGFVAPCLLLYVLVLTVIKIGTCLCSAVRRKSSSCSTDIPREKQTNVESSERTSDDRRHDASLRKRIKRSRGS